MDVTIRKKNKNCFPFKKEKRPNNIYNIFWENIYLIVLR